jgi:hypothetical protein
MTGVPYKRKRHRDSHVRMEAEIAVLHKQTKEYQGLLATPEAEKRTWDKFFPRVC